MREIVLGTAGHVDHGKTSLVRALTGQDTDRLKEEKRRGITIELGFVWLDLPCGHRLGIVDVPGHEKFVKTMVAGVSGIDMVAFIIAADEGIMPQSIEHMEICRLMGVDQGIVVITKKDMVEPDWLEMVNEEIADFCGGTFLEDAPVINVSSRTGEGIDEVLAQLDSMVKAFEFKEAFGPFRLPVDRCFALKGFGTVVTGTSISGRMQLGEEVRLFPGSRQARVRSIQVHGISQEVVEAGHRTAVNLQGVEVADLIRGMVVAPAQALEPGYMLDVRYIYLASAGKPLKHRARVRVDIGSTEVMARLSLLDRDELQPGEEVYAQLLCEEQVAVWPGDRFVIRSYSPVFTVGGGEVVGNVSPRKRKRATENDREQSCAALATLEKGSSAEKILLLLAESREQGLTEAELGIRLGLFGKHLKKVLQQPVSTKKAVVVDSATQRLVVVEIAEQIKQMMLTRLAEWHKAHPLVPGIVREELRTGLPRPVEVKVFNYCLNELVRREKIVQEESLLHLAGHQVALKADEEELQRELADWFRDHGLKAPTMKETMEHFSDYPAKMVKEVMEVELRDGLLLKVSESLYYAAEILTPLIDRVVAHLNEHGEIDAQAFKEISGLSRKFSIPILEYLDRIKLTMRLEDRRVLRGSGR